MKRLPYNHRPRKWDDPYTRFMALLGGIAGICVWMLFVSLLLLKIVVTSLLT